MKNRFIVLLLAVAGLLLLAGGSQLLAAKVTEIIVPDLSDPSQGGSATFTYEWQQVFEKKHPEIKITHVARESVQVEKRAEYWATQFQTGAQTMIFFDMIPQAMTLVRMGLCKPFDKTLLPELSKLPKALVDDMSVGGQLYMYPGFAEAFGLVVRRSYLKEAGLPEDYAPKSWDDFATMAKKLTTADHWALAFFATGDYSQNPTEQFLWANGAKRATEDSKRRVTLNYTAPEVVQAVQFMKDLIYKYKVTGPNPAADWGTCFSGEFMAGKAAMHQWYPSWISWAFTESKFKADDLSFLYPPKGPSGKAPYTRIYCGGYAIGKTATADQVRACTLYAQHMRNPAWYDAIYQWASENEVSWVQPTPFTGYDWTKLSTGVPGWWLAPVTAYYKIAVPEPAPDNLAEKYWEAALSRIYTNPNSDVKAELAAAQTTAENEWLKKYNAEIK